MASLTPLSRCTVQVCSYQRVESSQLSTTEVLTDRPPQGWGAHDGQRSTSMSIRHPPAGGGAKHLPAGGGAKHSPAGGGAKWVLGFFSQETTAAGQCSQTSSVLDRKVARFFRAKKRDVKEFSTTHFIVSGKTMLLTRFIDSAVNVPVVLQRLWPTVQTVQNIEKFPALILAQVCGYVHQP